MSLYTGEYRVASHSICNLKYGIPKEVSVVFRNGSNYDYHLIIKQLSKGFEGEFNYPGENTKNYKNFSVPVTKEVKKVGKTRKGITKYISYKLKFIDSAKLMAKLLSNLVEDLAEGTSIRV